MKWWIPIISRAGDQKVHRTRYLWQAARAYPRFGHIIGYCSYEIKVLIRKQRRRLHTASVNSVSGAPHERSAILNCDIRWHTFCTHLQRYIQMMVNRVLAFSIPHYRLFLWCPWHSLDFLFTRNMMHSLPRLSNVCQCWILSKYGVAQAVCGGRDVRCVPQI
jgi:hypothetical protein